MTGQTNLDLSMPVTRQTRLANGLRVVTMEIAPPRPSNVAVVQVRIPNGSALDGELPGISRVVGSMLTRGSEGRTLDEIAEELDGLGAAVSVGVGGEATDISVTSLAEDSDRVLGIMTGMILKPDFPESQVPIVRGQMLAGLRQAENSTRSMADRQMREQIYPQGHPYHQRSGGTEESLAAISSAELARHHAANYQPSKAIVSLAGGISHEDAVALIEKHLGGWSGETPLATVEPGTMPESLHRIDSTLPGKTQADIAMGLPAPTRAHPDYYALTVANHVIGRFGLMGRLGERVRERQGMAYYAFSGLEAGKSVGLWSAKAGVAAHNVDGAIESILQEVRGFIEEGPTEREFADCIGSLVGGLPIALESSGTISSIAADIVFYGLGDDYLQRYRGIIEGLTPDDLRQAASDHINPDKLIVSVVGPA